MEKTKKQDDTNIQAELDKCKAQCEDYLNNWKRERADFLNYKKEEARRVEEIIRFANEGLALEIVDVLDGLEVAMKNRPVQIKEKHPDWLEGMEKAISNFQKILEKYNIKRIKVEGEKFNPALHEAVETEPAAFAESSGEPEDGEKLEEVMAGYMIQDKVIRPARVKITKK